MASTDNLKEQLPCEKRSSGKEVMSFKENHRFVENGDTIVLYLGHNSMQSVKIHADKVHQTKFGAFPHSEIIGKEYGSKIFSKNKRGWVYLLHLSPELWTATLPHRTQILYTTDISLVIFELELKPGSVVIESGTGSGSMSHALVRTVMPSGHVYTFDFHQLRANQARKEFEEHGISEYITAECKDVCNDGFGLTNIADAVFLDLPKPWEAIEFAKISLKASGSRLCSFSPCIEQVQRTCEQLRKLGFCEIKTVECLCNTYDVRTVALPEIRVRKTNSTEDPNARTANEVTTNASEKPDHSDVNQLKRTHSEESKTDAVSRIKKQKPGYKNLLTARPIKEIPGHTGFLTFASLVPPYEQS